MDRTRFFFTEEELIQAAYNQLASEHNGLTFIENDFKNRSLRFTSTGSQYHGPLHLWVDYEDNFHTYQLAKKGMNMPYQANLAPTDSLIHVGFYPTHQVENVREQQDRLLLINSEVLSKTRTKKIS